MQHTTSATVEGLTALHAALALAIDEARQSGNQALVRELEYQQARVGAEVRAAQRGGA